LANLSKWQPEPVDGLWILLTGGTAVPDFAESFVITRSLLHESAVVLGILCKLGLDRQIDKRASPMRHRVVVIVARVTAPASKLATMHGMAAETAATTLGKNWG